jgi:hypothetical protein
VTALSLARLATCGREMVLRAMHLTLAVALVAPPLAHSDAIMNRFAVELSSSISAENALAQVDAFKATVASGSCFLVAALTHFPLRMNRAGTTTWISNRTAFCRYFPVLFDDARSARVSATSLNDMPAGYRGLKLGNGDFWLQPVCPNDHDPTENQCPKGDLRLRLTVANLGSEGGPSK